MKYRWCCSISNISCRQSFCLKASRFASRARSQTFAVPRRSAMTVPKLGTEAEMKAEAIAQLRARIEYQKELIKAKGHNHEEEVNEMWRWINLTFYVGVPVCIASSLYSYLFDEHPHRVEGDLPEYMKIRNKEFPWECSDCDYLDKKCWNECRAEKN